MHKLAKKKSTTAWKWGSNREALQDISRSRWRGIIQKLEEEGKITEKII